MRFCFDKAACQNTRRALRKEWLLTNGLGDYSSSSILYCNTRKYHGLLVAASPSGRQVLLSAMEESVAGGGKEFFISTRQHPNTLYPQGHQYLEDMTLDPWPQFTYRVGDVRIIREIIMENGKTRLLIRWKVEGTGRENQSIPPKLELRVKPLLAYRGFHQLTRANNAIQHRTQSAPGGFGIQPYPGMPEMFFQISSAHSYQPAPCWYYNVKYFRERDRGFDDTEDLFQPGIIDIPLSDIEDGGCVYMAIGTEALPRAGEEIAKLWDAVAAARAEEHKKVYGLIGHLEEVGKDFCVAAPGGQPQVIAGYHWFDAWGRDTLIALPGLAFYGGREKFGLDVLSQVPNCMRDGLVPNIFSGHADRASYNSADASLWYAFAVQCYLEENPDGYGWARENAWRALKEIVNGYRRGPGMGIFVDGEGLLHAGDAHTQLTWMDATSNGHPVTPRNGCPVELNALWYNTMAFVDKLARKFGDSDYEFPTLLKQMRDSFYEHFWVAREGGYLGDVWSNGLLDQSIRPNQILAVSLPYPVLRHEHQGQVVACVRRKLLTSYGLRTLAPEDVNFKNRYEGGPAQRDAAYHQGTVWPWLLGHYTAALLRVAVDESVERRAESLLDRVTPLFTEHLADAGIGSISEIFDAAPPALPHGAIAQAWSVAECLRMLVMLRRAAPGVYDAWEHRISKLLAQPVSGDTAGVCRATLALEPVTKHGKKQGEVR